MWKGRENLAEWGSPIELGEGLRMSVRTSQFLTKNSRLGELSLLRV